MGTMDIIKQRLIKQCKIILGEDFWTDFVYEDVNFSSSSEVKEAYEKFVNSYKDEYETIVESKGPVIDGRTKEFREKLKALLYAKELSEKQIKGVKNKADESGISYGILKKVFDRGMAAWKTGHRPGATPHQWAYARINSFITGGKTRTTGDKDLWAQHKGQKEDLEESLYGEAASCPVATQDLKVNTKNRDATIKEFNYGPLNVVDQ